MPDEENLCINPPGGGRPDGRASSPRDLSTVIKGWGVTILGSLVFFGSAYVLLAAIFGRWMGYLVTAVSVLGNDDHLLDHLRDRASPAARLRTSDPAAPRYSCPTCISEPHWATVAVAENITSPAFDAVARSTRRRPWEAPDDETTR